MLTTAFEGARRVERLRCVRLDWVDGRPQPVPGSEFELRADLVLLAMGFTGTVFGDDAELIDAVRGTIRAAASDYATSRSRVFACGDARRGQSLVVVAIREGRDCAAAVHAALARKDAPRI